MKFKSGYFDWKVRFLPYMDEIGNHGDTDFDKKEIRIDSTMISANKKETLLHEILHVCLEDSGHMDEALEEKVIRIISPRLIHILAENADLRDYILGKDE